MFKLVNLTGHDLIFPANEHRKEEVRLPSQGLPTIHHVRVPSERLVTEHGQVIVEEGQIRIPPLFPGPDEIYITTQTVAEARRSITVVWANGTRLEDGSLVVSSLVAPSLILAPAEFLNGPPARRV